MLLRSLLPASVLYAEMDPRLAQFAFLHVEEAAQIQSSVEKRRRQYAAGRSLARSLLDEKGIRDFPLLNGENRAPQWPDGILGSISHCDTLCAVAIAGDTQIQVIGIDVEPAIPLPREAEMLAVLPEDYSSINRLPESLQAVATRLVFSAKEAAYKAIHPRTQLFLEFAEIQIELHEAGSFTASILNVASARIVQSKIHGRYVIDANHLGTSVVF